MKIETIKHPTHTVSLLSESMAEHFKGKVTKAQYDVLIHNVYSIGKEDKIAEKYHGCGCGWCEVDKEGAFVDAQYLDEEVVDWREDDNEWSDMAVVASQEVQALYLNTGQEEQNVNMLEFHTDQLTPLILPNGNMRMLVNFSSYQMVRF